MNKEFSKLIIVIVLCLSLSCAVYKIPPGIEAATVLTNSDYHFCRITKIDGKYVNNMGSAERVQIAPGKHTISGYVADPSKVGVGQQDWSKEIDIPGPGNYVLHVMAGEYMKGLSWRNLDIKLEKYE